MVSSLNSGAGKISRREAVEFLSMEIALLTKHNSHSVGYAFINFEDVSS